MIRGLFNDVTLLIRCERKERKVTLGA